MFHNNWTAEVMQNNGFKVSESSLTFLLKVYTDTHILQTVRHKKTHIIFDNIFMFWGNLKYQFTIRKFGSDN